MSKHSFDKILHTLHVCQYKERNSLILEMSFKTEDYLFEPSGSTHQFGENTICTQISSHCSHPCSDIVHLHFTKLSEHFQWRKITDF